MIVTNRVLGLLLATLLLGGAEELVAQRPGGGGGQRPDMERRIQARFDDLVREQLDLNNDQLGRLQDVVDGFRVRRFEFSQRERRSRRRVAGLGGRGGRGGGGVGGDIAELTDEEASEILETMLELSDDEAGLFRDEQEAILEILSAPQAVRYIVLRQQLGDRIRALRGGGGAGRGGRGGRGPAQFPL
jgi:hypothetical protein